MLGHHRRTKGGRKLKTLATAIDQATEGVIITDTEELFRTLILATGSMTGDSREELIGANLRYLKMVEHLSVSHDAVMGHNKSKVAMVRVVSINRKKDGTMVL